jgi:hypothetical protein
VSDLVDRLRLRWEAMGDMANDEREEAANAICNLRADLQNAYDRIKTLTDERDEAVKECNRLEQRNTMLVNELSERGRVFTPEQLKAAIVKALYESQG